MRSDEVPPLIATVVLLLFLGGFVFAVANHFYRKPQVDQAAATREVAVELRRLNDTLEKHLPAKEPQR